MKAKHILYTLGGFLLALGFTMVVPLVCSLYYGEGDALSFIISIMVTSGAGATLLLLFRPKDETIVLGHREGFIIVTAGWLLAAVFGSLPYVLEGIFPTYADAFFETMSGFTTTGATVIKKIEGLPRGIILWRSLSQWLGGMGIIILSIAILPFLGVGGRQLFRAELPGPVKDKLKPRIVEAARSLWLIYIIISLVEFILLLFGGMSVYDSLCHTFSTMATGGFSPKDASVGHYGSLYIDLVITVFMVAAGMNFTLHFLVLSGKIKSLFKDGEFLFFMAVIFIATGLITINIWGSVVAGAGESLRYASFQVVSILTTTGFVTHDFSKWPVLSQIILVLLMFVGGSAGSTSGGIKCVRFLLVIKHSYRELYRLVHPHAVIRVKLGESTVSPDIMASIWGFFVLYIALTLTAILVMSLLGLDMITAVTSVAATISNTGPGLGMVHPMTNYSEIPYGGKWILSFCMLLGRLEIYTVLVLLIPEFWRK
ncbi:MAG: potassium transporter TrkG [Smithellaceae bacterium]|nr:potassium transporter TrkG [Smithellaceae bacterium]